MAEQRLTDNEIIKAFEEITQTKKGYIWRDVLDLINRQRAEIERLNIALDVCQKEYNATFETSRNQMVELDAMRTAANSLKMHLKKYQDIESTIDEFWTGLEKLSMFKGKEKPTLEELLEYIEQVKVDAYKEFAERLKERSIEVDVSFGYGKEHYTEAVPVIEIDNVVAELTDNTFTKIDHNSLCETETYQG